MSVTSPEIRVHPSILRRDRQATRGGRYWKVYAVLATAYCFGYAVLLLGSSGVPYVLDNNESFSEFLQARNMLSFPMSATAGLADEASAPVAAAHPFVYTHGGELSRFFAVLLDIVGVRTVEAHIAVTTLVVGLVGLYVAYHLFSQLGGIVFGALVCLVLFSDYILFAQWQVDTWRIWQAVLLFSTLVCVESFDSKRRAWRYGLVTLGFGLAYYQLIFAAFVLAFAGLLAVWRYRAHSRTAFTAIALLGTGALASVLVLALQRIMYLGWNDALVDAQLTFMARLFEVGTPAEISTLQSFYASRHVMFWYDVVDGRGLSSPWVWVSGVMQYGFQVATPLFASIALVLAAGWLFGLPRHRSASVRTRPGAGFATAAALFLAWAGLLLVVFSGELVLGVPPAVKWTFVFWDGSARALIAAVCGAAVAMFGLVRLATGGWRPGQLSTARLAAVALLLTSFAVFLRAQYYFYAEGLAPLWLQPLGGWVPLWAAQLGVAAAALLASAMTISGSGRLLRAAGGSALRALGAYLGCGAVAYALLYFAAAGNIAYAFTTRYVPLLVFLVDVVVAIAMYCALVLAAGAVRRLMSVASGSSLREAHARQIAVCVAAAIPAVAVAAFMLVYWTHTQLAYAVVMPASLFSFLPTLREPPFAGARFVVNNSAATVSAFTGQWAYYDPVIAGGVTQAGYILARDTQTYGWFADRDTNPTYQRPDYFLCVLPETLASAAARIRQPQAPTERCSALPLVRGAVLRPDTFPHQLIARDESGHDAWAIVKLNSSYQVSADQPYPVPSEGDLARGAHWYPLETYGGETFQWIDNDAEIIATAPLLGENRLRLDVEGGPGLATRDFVIQVLDRQGAVVGRRAVAGRQIIEFNLPLEAGATEVFRLHVDGGGRATPGDWRSLNFRVFTLDWSSS